MSTARFTAALAPLNLVGEISPTEIVQGSSATATMTAKSASAVPARHYVWVYDLNGTKVDVLA